MLKVVKLGKHNVLFIFSPDKGFWYVPGEFAILQYGMWECSKVGNNAYFRLFKLAAGKLFHVPSCAFYTNDFFCFCLTALSFLVDACMRLLAQIDTEGLFRKSGSVVRLKALRVSDG